MRLWKYEICNKERINHAAIREVTGGPLFYENANGRVKLIGIFRNGINLNSYSDILCIVNFL